MYRTGIMSDGYYKKQNIMANTNATPSLKGTKTAECLASAYVGESIAVTRYTIYANKANKENYFFFSRIFTETAANEMHHAKVYLQLLLDGGVAPGPVSIDSGEFGSTLRNIQIAAEEERVEGVEAYKKSAEIARSEGFDSIADIFESIAAIEEHHRRRFEAMAKEIEDGTVWKRDTPIKWQCDVCGYIFEGTEPPKVCPACAHPYQHYFPEAREQF